MRIVIQKHNKAPFMMVHHMKKVVSVWVFMMLLIHCSEIFEFITESYQMAMAFSTHIPDGVANEFLAS